MGLKDLEKNIYRRETRAKLDSDRKNLTKYTIYNQNLVTDKLEYQTFKEADIPFLVRYKKILAFFLGGGILIISIIFLVNQAYIFYLSRFVENNIIISFEGQNAVVATEESEYLIKYKNNNDIPISNIQIDIELPESMTDKEILIYEDDVEKVSESQRLVIDKMEAKQEVIIKIKGGILAEKNTIHTIKTIFLYNSERAPTKLRQSAEYKVNIIDNPITLDIAAPFDAASGEVVEYKITLNNKKSQDLNDLELRLNEALRKIESIEDHLSQLAGDLEVASKIANWDMSKLIEYGELKRTKEKLNDLVVATKLGKALINLETIIEILNEGASKLKILIRPSRDVRNEDSRTRT